MKLYKFRKLENCQDLKRIESIVKDGFYCNDFFSFNDMNEGVYWHNEGLEEKIIFDFFQAKKKYKICSFSTEEAMKSELMWGHYANAGKGVVIEVDVDEKHQSSIYTVKYLPSREILTNFSDVKEVLITKSKSWSYEKEARFLSDDELVNNTIKLGKISKIYFGTPFNSWTNYDDVLKESKSLKKYLCYKKKLESYLASQNIKYENTDFQFGGE